MNGYIVLSLVCFSTIQLSLAAPSIDSLSQKLENLVSKLDATQEGIYYEINYLNYYTENFKLDVIESKRISELKRKFDENSSKEAVKECVQIFESGTLTVGKDFVEFYRGTLRLFLQDVSSSLYYTLQQIPYAKTKAEFKRLEEAVESLIKLTNGLEDTTLHQYLTPAVDGNYRSKVYEPTIKCIDNL